jgi:hypothetical protein
MCDCGVPNTLGTHAGVRSGRIRRRIEKLPQPIYTSGPGGPCCPNPPTVPSAPAPCPPVVEKTLNPNPAFCGGATAPVFLDVSGVSTRFDLPLQNPIPRPIDRIIPVDVRRPRAGRRTAQIRDLIAAQAPPQWNYSNQFIGYIPCTLPPPQTITTPIPSQQSCNYGNSRTVDRSGVHR